MENTNNTKEFERLRQEFTSEIFRKEMKKKVGCKCVNCGSRKHIEYHHIVPLVKGGTNNWENIVPLCYECHLKAHDRHTHGDKFKKAKEEGRVGRKHCMSYEECLPYLEKYFNNEIGAKELKRLCKFSSGYKICSITYIKRYKKEHNIDHFKNYVDIRESQKGRKDSLRIPKKTYEEAFPYLEALFNGDIDDNEFKRICGYSEKTSIDEITLVKQYKRNIKLGTLR